jgi:hyperosmotically inducible protein
MCDDTQTNFYPIVTIPYTNSVFYLALKNKCRSNCATVLIYGCFFNKRHQDKTMENASKSTLCRILAMLGLSVVIGLTACEQQGPAETAGKQIDQEAKKIEKEFSGTKEAISNKTQSPEEYFDDAAITAKIKQDIINDPILNVFQIEVTTINGVVSLRGVVDSEQIIIKVIDLVSKQKHVKAVQNNLLVKASQ